MMIFKSHMQKIIQIYLCLLKLSRKQESVSDEQTDGQTDGRTDRRTDGRIDGHYYYIHSPLSRGDKNRQSGIPLQFVKKYNITYYTLKFEYPISHFERIVIHYALYTNQTIKYKKVKIRSLLNGVFFSFKIAWFLNGPQLNL